jgi:hypothetical protein
MSKPVTTPPYSPLPPAEARRARRLAWAIVAWFLLATAALIILTALAGRAYARSQEDCSIRSAECLRQAGAVRNELLVEAGVIGGLLLAAPLAGLLLAYRSERQPPDEAPDEDWAIDQITVRRVVVQRVLAVLPNLAMVWFAAGMLLFFLLMWQGTARWSADLRACGFGTFGRGCGASYQQAAHDNFTGYMVGVAMNSGILLGMGFVGRTLLRWMWPGVQPELVRPPLSVGGLPLALHPTIPPDDNPLAEFTLHRRPPHAPHPPGQPG